MKKRKTNGKKRTVRPKRSGRSRTIVLLLLLLAAGLLAAAGLIAVKNGSGQQEDIPDIRKDFDIQVELLTPNKYSRPQLKLKQVRGIVVHYVANPGVSAQNNRDYFESLAKDKSRHVSSHFVIGLKGEIIQCIPTTEIAYASNSRNSDTLSIECCHPDKTGKLNAATYQSLVKLTAWLCGRFNVAPENVIRHYDITKKICPKYFVDHPEAWKQFRSDVREKLGQSQLNS